MVDPLDYYVGPFGALIASLNLLIIRPPGGYYGVGCKGVGKNHENMGAIDVGAKCIKTARFSSISAPPPSSMLILLEAIAAFGAQVLQHLSLIHT